jgi:hypothetical protein
MTTADGVIHTGDQIEFCRDVALFIKQCYRKL